MKNISARLAVILGAPALVGAGVLLLLLTDPLHGRGPVPCFFYQLTGLYCIGCGSTRALAALLQGDLAAACSYNVFMLFWLPWPAYSLLALWLQALAGRRILPQIRDYRLLMIILLASALAFFILRNLPWYPLDWLAP